MRYRGRRLSDRWSSSDPRSSADGKTRAHSEFSGHRRNNSPPRRVSNGEYFCEFCSTWKFRSLQEWFTHSYSLHFPINFCMYCHTFVQFDHSISLNQVLKMHYNMPFSVHNRDNNSIWDCLFCFYRSNRKDDVDRHLRERHAKEFAERHCQTCDATFPTIECYTLHLQYSCFARREPLLGLYPPVSHFDADASRYEPQNMDAAINKRFSLGRDFEAQEVRSNITYWQWIACVTTICFKNVSKRSRNHSSSSTVQGRNTEGNAKFPAKTDLVEVSTPIVENSRPTRIRFHNSPSPPSTRIVETTANSKAEWGTDSVARTETSSNGNVLNKCQVSSVHQESVEETQPFTNNFGGNIVLM